MLEPNLVGTEYFRGLLDAALFVDPDFVIKGKSLSAFPYVLIEYFHWFITFVDGLTATQPLLGVAFLLSLCGPTTSMLSLTTHQHCSSAVCSGGHSALVAGLFFLFILPAFRSS